MNLWKISQTVNTSWDTFDSAVVAAETEDEAVRMHPGDGDISEDKGFETWTTKPVDVTCVYLGIAKDNTPKGVICASYNAG